MTGRRLVIGLRYTMSEITSLGVKLYVKQRESHPMQYDVIVYSTLNDKIENKK